MVSECGRLEIPIGCQKKRYRSGMVTFLDRRDVDLDPGHGRPQTMERRDEQRAGRKGEKERKEDKEIEVRSDPGGD